MAQETFLTSNSTFIKGWRRILQLGPALASLVAVVEIWRSKKTSTSAM